MSKARFAAAERDLKRTTEELHGVFDSVRWQSDDGTFIIAKLEKGVSIKGNAKPGSFIRGCEYVFSGSWQSNDKFGPSFAFTAFVAKTPVTPESVSAYLLKHLAGIGAGIGESGIRKLILEYGAEQVVGRIKDCTDQIASFLGITEEKAKLASETMKSIEKHESTRIALTQLFEGRGFPQSTVEACIDVWGVNAVDAIKRDPFTMLVRGFYGCGFQRVNALYEALNLPKNRLKRQVICMWHLTSEGNGSVWYESQWVIQELTRLVSTNVKFTRALRIGVRAKWLSSCKDSDGKVWIAAREHSAVEAELADSICVFLVDDSDQSI